MIFTFDQFLSLLQSYGPAGLLAGLLVLLFVYVGTFTDLLPNGNARRIANAVLSALFGVVAFPSEAGAVISAIAGFGSSLAYWLIEALVAALKARTKK